MHGAKWRWLSGSITGGKSSPSLPPTTLGL
jgi:hypothetical protein